MQFSTSVLALLLAIQASVLVSGSVVFVHPNAQSVWTKGNTYDIEFTPTEKDEGQQWKVSLMVLGGKCSTGDICLSDGVVSEIASNFDASHTLSYTLPKDIVQCGKDFFIQLSKDGAPPTFESEKFTISCAGGPSRSSHKTEESGPSTLHKRADTKNAASSALPALLVTFGSCLFALCLI
ncbi:hypothetical protein EMPS_06671 [Entomortierella parvispora]|uniref:Uncharacterized protein n=1 Tax=Entomortierella parvispora TaxID=205924 RepID=A0A9P3HDF4_9FUNG|nr:hypothetical protein EMPS_06671 [Entomortierella parvispora]